MQLITLQRTEVATARYLVNHLNTDQWTLAYDTGTNQLISITVIQQSLAIPYGTSALLTTLNCLLKHAHKKVQTCNISISI